MACTLAKWSYLPLYFKLCMQDTPSTSQKKMKFWTCLQKNTILVIQIGYLKITCKYLYQFVLPKSYDFLGLYTYMTIEISG